MANIENARRLASNYLSDEQLKTAEKIAEVLERIHAPNTTVCLALCEPLFDSEKIRESKLREEIGARVLLIKNEFNELNISNYNNSSIECKLFFLAKYSIEVEKMANANYDDFYLTGNFVKSELKKINEISNILKQTFHDRKMPLIDEGIKISDFREVCQKMISDIKNAQEKIVEAFRKNPDFSLSISDFDIKQIYGHYEAVGPDKLFVCSGDTYREVADDLLDIIDSERENYINSILGNDNDRNMIDTSDFNR